MFSLILKREKKSVREKENFRLYWKSKFISLLSLSIKKMQMRRTERERE